MASTRSQRRRNLLSEDEVVGKTIDHIESLDSNNGNVNFTIFYSDDTSEYVSHSLVSDILVALASIQLSGANDANKLIVQKADTSTMFRVDTSGSQIYMNLPLASGSVYPLVFDATTKKIAYYDQTTIDTSTGQTISSGGTTSVYGSTSTIIGSVFPVYSNTSVLGGIVDIGTRSSTQTTRINLMGDSIQITNPPDASFSSVVKVTSQVIAQISPGLQVVSAPLIQTVAKIFNVFRKR